MKFARFARTFCQNVGTFGTNLCKLFPNLRIRHSKVGQETSKLGVHASTILTVKEFSGRPDQAMGGFLGSYPSVNGKYPAGKNFYLIPGI